MSGNFEVCPIGTLQRLAAVEAERDSMREILDHIPQVEAELAETSDKLHAMTVERDALLGVLRTIEATKRLAREMQQEWCPAAQGMVRMARAAIAKAEGGGNG